VLLAQGINNIFIEQTATFHVFRKVRSMLTTKYSAVDHANL